MPDWLFRYGVAGIVGVVATLGFALGSQAFNWGAAKKGWIRLDPIEGGTVMSGEAKLCAVLSGSFAGAILALASTNPANYSFAAVISLCLFELVFGGGAAATWIVGAHRWEWTSASFTWRGVFRARTLDWVDLVGVGKFWLGDSFSYVQSKTGRRIWWSSNALYSWIITDAVRTARPDLFGLPPAEARTREQPTAV